MKKFLGFILRTADGVVRCKVSLYSAETAFFLLISAVPFMLLLLSFAQYIIPVSKEELFYIISVSVPGASVPFISSVINEIYVSPTVSLISVSAITTLWSSSRGFSSIVRGLDEIYSGHEAFGYFLKRLYSFFYTFIFIASIIATLLVISLGNRIMMLVLKMYPEAEGLFKVISYIRPWFFILFLTFIFASCYTILPKKKLRFIKQLPGALFSAFAWICFSYGFGVYIDFFSNHSDLYGSLAAVMLFMLWLYFCLNIFMIGAVVNYSLSQINYNLQ